MRSFVCNASNVILEFSSWMSERLTPLVQQGRNWGPLSKSSAPPSIFVFGHPYWSSPIASRAAVRQITRISTQDCKALHCSCWSTLQIMQCRRLVENCCNALNRPLPPQASHLKESQLETCIKSKNEGKIIQMDY